MHPSPRLLRLLAGCSLALLAAACAPPGVPVTSPSGPSPAAVLVQRQLDAYNARDLDAFMAVYHPDVETFTQGRAQPDLRGHAQFRARYAALFATSPRLHARLVSRMVQGRFVIDQEHVTGFRGNEVVHAIAIFEIEGALIRRAWFIR